MKKTVFCFGSIFVKEDKLPLKMAKELRKIFPKIEFREVYYIEEIEDLDEINMIDIVKGIKKATIIHDLNLISSSKLVSLHDFDVGITLKLMKKMGKLAKVTIFGIPGNYDKRKALKELKTLIKSNLLSKSE